jgi:hypothetical protein
VDSASRNDPGESVPKRITFVNRYVPDEEVAGFFSGADVVVLPYLRSSGSPSKSQ